MRLVVPADDKSRLPLAGRWVAFAERRTALVLFAIANVAFAALALAMRLELRTDMTELLPDGHPAVVALRRVAGRQKSATNLVMLVHSPSTEANRAFVAAIAPQLERLVPSAFSEIQWHPDSTVPAFAARWKWLYADRAQLERAETLLDRIIARRENPLAVDLEGDPEAELRDLRATVERRLPATPTSPWFEAKLDGEQYLGVMMWRRLDGVATGGDRDTLAMVRAAVERVGPRRFDSRMRVEFTGGIAQAIDEQDGIRDDLKLATLLCFGFVGLALFLHFRRPLVMVVVAVPAILGLLLALALASVTIHHLNINTAFLISIIVGNGINAPIVVLARYGEERRRGSTPPAAVTAALQASAVGTFTATAAAAIAYGCLSLTGFRGFNQFGLLGSAGMLLAWSATFLAVPALVIAGERRWPGALTPGASLLRPLSASIGDLAERTPRLLLAVTAVLVAIAIVPLSRWARDPLEWNFDHLRTDDTPSQRLWYKMEAVGLGDVSAGYIGNKGVLLVDTPEQADPVAAALKSRDAARGPDHVLAAVRTLHSMLPSDVTAKLALLARVRAKIDRHRALVSDAAETRELDAWRPPDHLRPLTVDDLPRLVVDAFTETDGTRGRLIGIDVDRATYYDWNGHDLLRLADALQVDALGKHWVAASAPTVFAGMLQAVISDGPRVTIAAVVGVAFVIIVAFGVRPALPVLAALAIGLVWLGGALGLFGLRINFINFVALPITLGVGVDYAANIWARLSRSGEAVAAVIADTGAALMLCSLTTVIGYSALLLSRNRALRSFGLLADLGEVACLIAALFALPAVARLFGKRS